MVTVLLSGTRDPALLTGARRAGARRAHRWQRASLVLALALALGGALTGLQGGLPGVTDPRPVTRDASAAPALLDRWQAPPALAERTRLPGASGIAGDLAPGATTEPAATQPSDPQADGKPPASDAEPNAAPEASRNRWEFSVLGRVTLDDAEHTPAGGVQLQFVLERKSGARERHFSASNPDGSYRFFALGESTVSEFVAVFPADTGLPPWPIIENTLVLTGKHVVDVTLPVRYADAVTLPCRVRVTVRDGGTLRTDVSVAAEYEHRVFGSRWTALDPRRRMAGGGGFQSRGCGIPRHAATRQSDGSFVVFVPASGAWWLTVRVPGAGPSLRLAHDALDAPLVRARRAGRDLELTVMLPPSVRGRLVDDLGQPRAGAALEVRSPCSPISQHQPEPAITDAQGRFAVTNVPAFGPLSIRARLEPDAPWVALAPVMPDASGFVEIVWPRTGALVLELTGTSSDARPTWRLATPWLAAPVTLRAKRAVERASALLAGRYEVWVGVPGFAPHGPLTVEVPPGAVARLIVPLMLRGGTVSGTVPDNGGRPRAVKITVTAPDAPMLDALLPRATLRAAESAFRFEHLPPVPLIVTLRDNDGYTKDIERRVLPWEGSERDLGTLTFTRR